MLYLFLFLWFIEVCRTYEPMVTMLLFATPENSWNARTMKRQRVTLHVLTCLDIDAILPSIDREKSALVEDSFNPG